MIITLISAMMGVRRGEMDQLLQDALLEVRKSLINIVWMQDQG
jgi:hypothetical protein